MNFVIRKIIVSVALTLILVKFRPKRKKKVIEIKDNVRIKNWKPSVAETSKYPSINRRIRQYHKLDKWSSLNENERQDLKELNRRDLFKKQEKGVRKEEKEKEKLTIVINDPNKELDPSIHDKNYNIYDDLNNEIIRLSEEDEINSKTDSYTSDNPYPFTEDFKIEDLL